MERIKKLNGYQKCLLVLLTLLLVGFTVAYPIVYSREGFAYKGALLVYSEEGGQRVYAGHLDGEDASFTVTADQAVTFQYGTEIYGPYTLREDPTAIPEDSAFKERLKGIEILQGEEIFFRGGVLDAGEDQMLFNEDGSVNGVGIWESRDKARLVPTAAIILEVLEGPELTRRGDWAAWLCGVFASVVTAGSMLFADEIFRRKLSYHIRDAHLAEPSDREIAGRYITWTLLTIAAAAVYLAGLMT